MIKKIVLYSIVFSVLFFVAYTIQSCSLETIKTRLTIPLLSVYTFHYIASLTICIAFVILKLKKIWNDQLGFIYISLLVIKLMFFAAVFKNTIIKAENITKAESFNLLIPLFIFLFLEVYFIAKILNSK